MNKVIYIFLMMGLMSFCGCVSDGKKTKVDNLKEQLHMAKFKMESLKKENQDLKNEVNLLRENKNLDTKKFLDALSFLQKGLADSIAEGDVRLEISDRGLDIIVSSEKLFISGSDAISDQGQRCLDIIGLVLKENFFFNYVFIEGHTDNQSLAVFEWKSDWEFSFARALSVLKYFKEHNYVDPLRLSAVGFGQYRHRESNATKEGRKINRRVEIIVSPQIFSPIKDAS